MTFKYSVRVLILRSTTVGSFCAGADLIERRTMSQLQVSKFLADLRDALGKLESLPMPTIATIDGPALGGGLELSLACDLRVAGKRTGPLSQGEYATYLFQVMTLPRLVYLKPASESYPELVEPKEQHDC